MPKSQSALRTTHQALALRTAACVIGALLLTACSTPPKPPSVDESTKRPVNVKAAVDLKACEGDLSRATILMAEMARAEVVTAAVKPAQPMPAVATAVVVDKPPVAAPGNLIAVVGFALGSATWQVEAVDEDALVRRAKDAAAIMIRGRTDATGDSMQETALARRRAEAAAAFLQQAGVSKDKLRLTWQGAGDPVAGLRPAERGQSRRVEIEFYAAAPVLVSLRSGSANGNGTTAASL